MAVVSTYVAFEVTSLTGSYWLGLLAALLAGGLLGFAVEREDGAACEPGAQEEDESVHQNPR